MDVSSAPRSAFAGSGTSGRRVEFEDAVAGPADAASDHHHQLSVRRSVFVAVAADCQLTAVSQLPLCRHPGSDCRPCETASSETREAKSMDLCRLDLGHSFLTRQTSK